MWNGIEFKAKEMVTKYDTLHCNVPPSPVADVSKCKLVWVYFAWHYA